MNNFEENNFISDKVALEKEKNKKKNIIKEVHLAIIQPKKFKRAFQVHKRN